MLLPKLRLIILFFYIGIGLQNTNAQNIDSLLTIWNQANINASTKLAAIQVVLSTKAYYTSNLDAAEVLALAQYELAKQNSPNDLIDALINRMNIAYQKGQFLNIIDLANECFTIESSYFTPQTKAKALHLKAMGLEKSGRPEEAIKEYEKITTFDSLPNDILEIIYNGLGLCYYTLGSHSEAINAFQKYPWLRWMSGIPKKRTRQ